jgi:hypothetical protein
MQQYFSYIMAFSFVGGGNLSTRRKPQTLTDLVSRTPHLSGIQTHNVSAITLTLSHPELILNLYVFIHLFTRVISLTTDKMVPGLAKATERTTILSVILKLIVDGVGSSIVTNIHINIQVKQ